VHPYTFHHCVCHDGLFPTFTHPVPAFPEEFLPKHMLDYRVKLALIVFEGILLRYYTFYPCVCHDCFFIG
jgi:hypothetical protein